jgi:hypothetical protein
MKLFLCLALAVVGGTKKVQVSSVSSRDSVREKADRRRQTPKEKKK